MERILKLYSLWTIIYLVILYFFLQSPYSDYLLWIVLFLLLKDIFIDVLPKRGPTPTLFEHAPLVIIISIIGLLGIFEVKPFIDLISPLTTVIAIIDSFIDVTDDFTFRERVQPAPVKNHWEQI
ncbi:MAG: hypothetical protein ACFFCW_40925 [Candidatus Hodarchaeota archaeon]